MQSASRMGMPTRVIAFLAVVVLSTGTVLAADPSVDPSASAAPSAEPSASTASTTPSIEPSAEPSPSPASQAPSASAKPSKAPEPEASEAPDDNEGSEAAPSAAQITDIVAKLKAAGITTTEAAFKALVAQVGVGGAVRTLAFAHASGKTPAQILAMRDSMGWGQIRKQLNLAITPGIGWIMGGGQDH
jgi:hypothetical protein